MRVALPPGLGPGTVGLVGRRSFQYAFSKKFENHRHMIALTVVFYNFCKSHKSLGGKTPAQAAGLTDYVWTARDLLALDPTWTDRIAA